MARPRAFDHDDLKNLVFEHPTWSDQQLAAALTLANHRRGGSLAPVKATTVGSVLSRKKDTWQARAGHVLPARTVLLSDYLPPAGTLATEHKNDTPIRYLREIAKEARGQVPREDWQVKLRRNALNWHEGTIGAGQLVDLDPRGVPFTRFATAGERNADGTSKAIAAWLLPGWRGR
jgi:hypothetical protein